MREYSLKNTKFMSGFLIGVIFYIVFNFYVARLTDGINFEKFYFLNYFSSPINTLVRWLLVSTFNHPWLESFTWITDVLVYGLFMGLIFQKLSPRRVGREDHE